MTHKETISHLRSIFHTYRIGDIVSHEHVKLFSKYLDPYINDYKERGGVTTSIPVEKTTYNSPVFMYTNESGESTTANLKRAVKYFFTHKIIDNHRRGLYDACRNDIRDQIIDHKKDTNDTCSKCHQNFEYGETDHYPVSFCDLFDSAFAGKDISKIKIVRTRLVCWTIEDDTIRQEWQKYHLDNASLRELCVPCHREYSKLQRLIRNN